MISALVSCSVFLMLGIAAFAARIAKAAVVIFEEADVALHTSNGGLNRQSTILLRTQGSRVMQGIFFLTVFIVLEAAVAAIYLIRD